MDTKDLETIETETKEITLQAAKPIVDEASYRFAAETLKAIKGIIKKIDAVFDPLIKSANDHVKAIRDEKKKHTAPVESLEASLRASTADYMAKVEYEKRVEQAKRDAEAKEQEAVLAEFGIAAPVQAERVATVDKGGLSFREVWTYEITDPKLLPREFLTPDLKKIGEVARAMKELANIPGVRVYAEKTTIVR